MTKRATMAALDEFTLRDVLLEFRQLERFEQGKARCAICDRVMTWDNTLGVFAEGAELCFVCDDYLCFDQLREREPRAVSV